VTSPGGENVDQATVDSFGEEWAHFDQTGMSSAERRRHFEQYFHVFPWDALPADAVGFDAGCGSGRWAMEVAPRVGTLHCVDPATDALAVARKNLADVGSCVFHNTSINEMPIADGSMDFGYSLGVLHHIPDPRQALGACVRKLKPGAPFLVYLYYALDDRPAWFRTLWRLSDGLRHFVAPRSFRFKMVVATLLATFVYWPLARLALVGERLGIDVHHFPLATYRDRSYYSMRTDAIDRFGTRLEYRFTADEIREMMTAAGLERIVVSPEAPYWCVVGFRSANGAQTPS
jgi:SAM-dependent methyltransferase